MEITRDTVIQWLEAERRSQTWLSKQLGVSVQAVSNWLREKNPQTISASAQITIRALMEEDAAKSAATPPHNLILEFTDEQYGPIEQAALASKETVREWAKRILNQASEMTCEEIDSLVAASMHRLEAVESDTEPPPRKVGNGPKA